jgi:hypothetical protein
MPQYSNGNGSSDQITEAHEERIQRLEGSMQQVLVQTTATGMKLDHVAEKIAEGFEAMNARLDKGAHQFDLHEQALAEHKEQLSALRAAETARTKRWATTKKAALPLIATGAGVLATKFGEVLWTWISHLF